MKTDISPQQIINRLNRAEGQIKALKRRLETDSEPDCKEFITQVKAARSALKAVTELYVLLHIHSCQALPPKERDEHISEAVKLLARD